MHHDKPSISVAGVALSVCGLVCIAALAGCAATDLPAETPDGLQLVPDTKFDAVYLRPGVDFSTYDEIGLEPCEVSFRKNWLRDQNRDRLDLSNRVTQQDVDRIRDALAAECDKYFSEALRRDSRYTLVSDYADGEPVLVLKPAIVNLDVTAPDLQTSTRTNTYTTSAGEMTLSLEASDGTTGQVLARVSDRQREPDQGYMEWTTTVSNRADAERILRSWTTQLREGLDRLIDGT